MNIEDMLYEHITKDPFNEYYKFVEGIKMKLFCVQLGITEKEFNTALDSLVSKGLLKVALELRTSIKNSDIKNNTSAYIKAYK